MDKTNDHIFMRMQLCEKIKLEPAFISNSYKDEVLKRLKAKVEGICTKHGYIRPDSIEIHKVCSGRVELIGLNGSTVFDVYFWADVCNPLLGSILKCRISNINKFGILVEAGNIIEAIVAKNSVSIQSDVDLEKVRIGDDVMIEVVGKKYELNDKKISLIARIVRNKENMKTMSSLVRKSAYDNDEEEEEETRSLEGGDAEENDKTDDEDSQNDDESDYESDEEDNEEVEEEILSEKDDGNFFSDEEVEEVLSDDEFNDDIDSDNGSNGSESD
jgi:DNA-directed RNA polymerase subunit E'/Rpb7